MTANYDSALALIATFDTSAHNALLSESEADGTLFARILRHRYVRVAGLSIEEIVSCTDPNRRKRLADDCGVLLRDPYRSDCLLPQADLLRALVSEHRTNPADFDWRKVDVRTEAYRQELQSMRVILDDKVSLQQRVRQRELGRQHRRVNVDLRPTVDAIFADHRTKRPKTFRDALELFQAGQEDATSSQAKRLYDTVGGEGDARLQDVQTFLDCCPPFRAIVNAHAMTFYDLAIRNGEGSEKFQAGRNDMYMSIYLPYCQEFVTRDGEQERCLREVAAVSELGTEVVSYDEFLARLAREDHSR